MKRNIENTKCDYCRGSHHEKSCFKKKMDIMTKLLEENNIDVPDFARRGKHKPSLEQKDGKCLYALCARQKPISHISVLDVFVSDLQSDISKSETSTLPWKKPQTIHQSFLQKVVIFYQFLTCLLKDIFHSIQILPILIFRVIYTIICRL